MSSKDGGATLYGFAYTDAALRFLESRVPAKFKGQIKKKIAALAADPYPPGCKKLNGMDDTYRIRSGDFRILYTVKSNPQQIVVLDIGDRKEIYRDG